MRYSIWTAFILGTVALSAFSTDVTAMHRSSGDRNGRRDDERPSRWGPPLSSDREYEADRAKQRQERHKRPREEEEKNERRRNEEYRAEADRRKRREEREARRDREVLEAAKEMSRRDTAGAAHSPSRKKQKTDDASPLARADTPIASAAASTGSSTRHNPLAGENVDDFPLYSPVATQSRETQERARQEKTVARLEKAKEFARRFTHPSSVRSAAPTHLEQTPPPAAPLTSPPQNGLVHYAADRDPRRRPRLASVLVVNGATVTPSCVDPDSSTTPISTPRAGANVSSSSTAHDVSPYHAWHHLGDADTEKNAPSLIDDEDGEALGTHAAKCLFPEAVRAGENMALDEDSAILSVASLASSVQTPPSPSREPAPIIDIEEKPQGVPLEEINGDASASTTQDTPAQASLVAVDTDVVMAEDGAAPVATAAPHEGEAEEEDEMQAEEAPLTRRWAAVSAEEKFNAMSVIAPFLNFADFQALWRTSKGFYSTLVQNMRPDLPWMPRSSEVLLVEGVRGYAHIFPGVRSLHWVVDPRSFSLVMRTLADAKNSQTLPHLRRLSIEFKGDPLSQPANSQGLLSAVSIPAGLQELILRGPLAQRAVNEFWQKHATSSAPHPLAQYHHAQSLVMANGTYMPAQELQAIPFWKASAESGYIPARYKIAHIAWTAWTTRNQAVQEAVSLSPETAVAYLEEASKAGILDAQYYQGRIWYEGWDSLVANPEQAVTLWEKLAKNGHAGAAFWLSDALWRGVGIAQDQASALTHLQSAHAKGYGPAGDRITALNTAWNSLSASSRRTSQVRRVSPPQL